jgi:arylsulfatase A-like enzyme
MNGIMQHADRLKQRLVAWLRSGTLGYVLIYSGIFMLIHVGGTAGFFIFPEGREELIIETAFASPPLILQVIVYVLIVLTLNLLPLAFLLVSMRVAENGIRRIGASRLSYFLIAVLCLWTAILAFNKLYFPRSSFALLLPFDESQQLAWIGGVAGAVFIVLGVLPALWRITTYALSALRRRTTQVAIGVVLGIGIVQPIYSYWAAPQAPTQQPNIIVIGIDSLSPLHMIHHPGALPKLEKLLEESTVFSNTLTPLARTFPAWTSILTAKYPVRSGARFNLTAFEQVDTETTLPKLLKARGYSTVYAQDERKFNNLDETFGFDRIVGPEVGAAEFVLTKVADHPIANLTLLTPWARQLFPFIALNRAATFHYDPDEFVSAIVDEVPEDKSKPLFLAAHFCLAHYPYTWRTQGRWSEARVELTIEQKHIHALGALEKQVDHLIQALKKSGRLENAILVVLSDHGESLGYRDELWASMDGYINRHDRFRNGIYSAFPADSGFSGHGSNVLDRTQYQSLLAFRAFGDLSAKFPAGAQSHLASLVDVMPTLMSALGVALPGNIDGVDLLGAGEKANVRVVPTETGIRFGALSSIKHIDEGVLLDESKAYYQIAPDSARLFVKPERYDDLIASKDIALHTDEWMLALLRKNGSPDFPRVAILVHKPTGAWTLGNDKGLIGRAPMALLRRTAMSMYDQEIADFNQSWAFN